jgi:hypothetical protein
MAPSVIEFDDAIKKSAAASRRHLLLGNGFSIACRPDCFRYDALLEHAQFGEQEEALRTLFEVIGTNDFEEIIRSLRNAAMVCRHYGGGTRLCKRLDADAEIVREALATVLASRHPDRPYDISTTEYSGVRTFLRLFNNIYTLNYDMLLYWAAMQSDIEPPFRTNDGFGESIDPEADYVAWQSYDAGRGQSLFFLHGGLTSTTTATNLPKSPGRVPAYLWWSRSDQRSTTAVSRSL